MTGHATPTSLTAFLPVTGDPVRLAGVMAEDPEGWLPDGASDGPDQRRFTIHCESGVHTVSVRISQPWWSANTLWRTVSWDAIDGSGETHGGCPHLSALDGELGLHTSPGAVSLILDVRYTSSSDGGDVSILHRDARSTAERLLVDIASGLTRAAAVDEVPVVASR